MSFLEVACPEVTVCNGWCVNIQELANLGITDDLSMYSELNKDSLVDLSCTLQCSFSVIFESK